MGTSVSRSSCKVPPKYLQSTSAAVMLLFLNGGKIHAGSLAIELHKTSHTNLVCTSWVNQPAWQSKDLKMALTRVLKACHSQFYSLLESTELSSLAQQCISLINITKSHSCAFNVFYVQMIKSYAESEETATNLAHYSWILVKHFE